MTLKKKHGHGRFYLGLAVVVSLTLGSVAVAPSVSSAGEAEDFALAKEYAETFYPRWLSYVQNLAQEVNQLVGPEDVGPLIHMIVALNKDTLYATTPLDTTGGPVTVSVPETTVSYSVLNMDVFGNVYDFGIPSQPDGTVYPATDYYLTPPGWVGSPPPGVTQVPMDQDFMLLIFRADRYRTDDTDVTSEADIFRRAIEVNGSPTEILPEVAFAFPLKTAADDLMRFAPMTFLAELQTAVQSPNTAPLTATEQALSDAFDAAFPSAGSDQGFKDGTRAAHRAIVDNYLDAAGATGWIHFTNVGAWGDAILDRASSSMFLQYGNTIKTSAYYHAFVDGSGDALTGATPDGYILKFAADQIPPAENFWSLTAYTPETIGMIPNDIDKYHVASYTPGLVMDPDGGVTIYLSEAKPEGVAEANWLPVGSEDFNVVLRIYGVADDGSVADNTYVPPAVLPYQPTTTTTTTTPAPAAAPATPLPAAPSFTG